jgi:hypothetical protein
LGYWGIGVLGYWGTGELESWRVGELESWSTFFSDLHGGESLTKANSKLGPFLGDIGGTKWIS